MFTMGMRGTYDATLVRAIHDVRDLVPVLPIVQDNLEIRTDTDKVVPVGCVFNILYKLGVFSDRLPSHGVIKFIIIIQSTVQKVAVDAP